MAANSKGEAAQALMGRSIQQDARKDGLYWALRIYGTGADAGKFEDVLLDVCPREVTTRDVMRWGKASIAGGWKIALGGQWSSAVTSLGAAGAINESSVFVRGTGWVTADEDEGIRAHVTGGEHFQVEFIHRLMNGEFIQEQEIYLQPKEGGDTRG